jgi:C4-dicarboxylate-specific signal transduction histidine kinase
VQRIISLVRQLSFLGLNSRLHRTRCRLEDLLNGALARFRHETGLNPSIEIVNPHRDVVIETNVEMFEDGLVKILLNAWEAYGDHPTAGRRIWLRVELLDKAEGKVLRLLVEDAGRGIASEVRDHLFEPFISTKRTVGVGMGLTVARHTFRNLGGDVTIGDRAGGGATAVLLHPLEKRRTREDDSRVPFTPVG